MTKDELRTALSELNQKIAVAEKAAEPARAALKPFQAAIDEVTEQRELLLDENGVVFVGHCEGCGKALFRGEPGFKYSDDEIYCCEECAPTLADVLKDNEESSAAGFEGDDDSVAESITYVKERIASGESPDTKCVYPL